jgi:four helix bundle protein
MKFTKFQEIIAWQKAKVLVSSIYKDLAECRDFGYRDQIQRASISIMSNIAEGYGRESQNEFIRFLLIAKGSAYEVESLLEVGTMLGYISRTQFHENTLLINEISKMIRSLVATLKIPKAKDEQKT